MNKIHQYEQDYPAVFAFAFTYMQAEENPDLIINMIKADNYDSELVNEYGLSAFYKDMIKLTKLSDKEWFQISSNYFGIIGKRAEDRYRKLFEVIAELALAERRRIKKLESEKVKEEQPKDPDYLSAGQTLITDLLDDKS